MSLRLRLGPIRRGMLGVLYRRTVPLGDHAPIVTFTFDDFPRTALTAGAAILEGYGVRATFYVAMSFMKKTNDLGEQFDNKDLITVRTHGHELASHTFSHFSAREVSFEKFADNVREGREKISAVAGIDDSGNFAYPYGDVTFKAKRNLGPKLISSRGTCGGINGPTVDLNLLRANSLYGGLDQFERVRNLLLQNQREKGWLIFYTHDVREKPSKFGCTPGLLEAAVSAAVKGARVLTIAAVLAELKIAAPQQEPVAL
jgi:peptidoglycan/xylan/chitin deacetylase (PgdA/CDA1 family)